MSIDVDPTWYISTMHFTAVLTTPINLIGVLIILFCETNQVQSLRWHLLTYHVCSLTTDFMINIGTLPVIFSPFAMGRPHGVFTWLFQRLGFPVSTEAQCIVVFISIFLTAGSVELLFFLRYQSLLPAHHQHKLSTFKSLTILGSYQLVWISFVISTFHIAVPNQSYARVQFVELHPELEYLLVDEHTFIVCVIVEPIHALFLLSCFIRLGFGAVTVMGLIWVSNKALHSFQLSVPTRKMHLQLIKNLCYQILIPILAFYGPILIVILPLVFTIPKTQVSFFVSLICLSLHTAFGTISMLYFNRPYRHWLLSAIRERSLTTSFSGSKIRGENRNASRADVNVSVLF